MRLKTGKETVLVIPDLQIPFHHKDTFDFLKALKVKYKPTKTVCIGDSIDAHALSNFIADPDGYSAGHEHKVCLTYMKELYKLFPEVTEVESNHNCRVYRRAFKAGIPRAFLKSYKEFLEAPNGWNFVNHCIIDSVRYEHGDSFSSGQTATRKAVLDNMQSTVIGHHHSHAGIVYVATENNMMFGANMGCLIDVSSYAFAYGKTLKFKPTLGAGVVIRGVPYFIPMLLDSKGRWTGELI